MTPSELRERLENHEDWLDGRRIDGRFDLAGRRADGVHASRARLARACLFRATLPLAAFLHCKRDELARHVPAQALEALDTAAVREGVGRALDWAAQPGRFVVTLADETYPRLLLEIADPPPLLYAHGRAELLRRPGLAIVGSRNATAQGARNAEEFARWRVEGPQPLDLLNVPYFEFVEREEASVRRVTDWLGDRGGDVVVLCAQGGSSAYVAEILQRRGLPATNLDGGMVAWGLGTALLLRALPGSRPETAARI